MRKAAVGFVLGLVLMSVVLATTTDRQAVHGQPAQGSVNRGQTAIGSPVPAMAPLIPMAWSNEQTAFVSVLDPHTRVLNVYEVNRTTGAIALRSVRNLSWDFQLEEYNNISPSPREIRALVERR